MLEQAAHPAPPPLSLTAGRPHALRFGRINLEVRQSIPAWRQALILAGAVITGMAISAALLIAAGVRPRALLDEFVVETLTDSENLHSIL